MLSVRKLSLRLPGQSKTVKHANPRRVAAVIPNKGITGMRRHVSVTNAQLVVFMMKTKENV